MKDNTPIERHILLGLIVSTQYLHEIRSLWESKFLISDLGKRVSKWCLGYYDKYGKAPQQDIEQIYFDHLQKENLPQDVAEDIELFLEDLSDEYSREEKFNVDYLLDRTRDYFNQRNLELHQEQIQDLVDRGDVQEAERLARAYQPVRKELEQDINLADKESLSRVEKAFAQQNKPLLEYPGALGEMLNPHLIRDGFVSLLAPEKRGKSFFLLDMARRGVRQRLNVAFFQAGDMSEGQQIRRLGIHLAKKSDLEIYAGEMWEPTKDCVHNQLDTCNLKIRERHPGLFGDLPGDEKTLRQEMTKEKLMELAEENPDYRPCYNCKKFHHQPWGCSWLEKVDVGPPLEQNEAVRIFEDYFVDKKRQFMLSTHPNNTLSVGKIRSILDGWYRQGFVPDLIVLDYADLLVDESREFRHKQDSIWKGLRSLSEERHCLVATATQADAKSYEQGLLKLSNFSEDKRKFSHATAFIGLNQDPNGREKEIGIMRLNLLLVREGESNPNKVVHVLQNLKRGQPVLTSFW